MWDFETDPEHRDLRDWADHSVTEQVEPLDYVIDNPYDEPSEVHKVTIATRLLKDYKAADGLFPSTHIPTLREQARARSADVLEHDVAQL
jgi:hypothetical protein